MTAAKYNDNERPKQTDLVIVGEKSLRSLRLCEGYFEVKNGWVRIVILG